jgi:hypothetical protein
MSLMTLAKIKARANETFKVQASLAIINHDSQNIFTVQATGFVMRQHHKTECITSILSLV